MTRDDVAKWDKSRREGRLSRGRTDDPRQKQLPASLLFFSSSPLPLCRTHEPRARERYTKQRGVCVCVCVCVRVCMLSQTFTHTRETWRLCLGAQAPLSPFSLSLGSLTNRPFPAVDPRYSTFYQHTTPSAWPHTTFWYSGCH